MNFTFYTFYQAKNYHSHHLQSMINGCLITLALSFVILHYTRAITFNGKTPPNSYIIPVVTGDVVSAYSNWTSSLTDLDLHIYQPGKVITDSTSDQCQCFCCSSSQTVTITANANGNIVVWAQQWGGAGVMYDLIIKKNGVTFITDTDFLSQNGSYHQTQVTSTPCTMFINFTSTGSFNLDFYAPNTMMSGGALKSMAYTGGSGNVDVAVPLTTNGAYDLKVIANPSSPAGGWSSFIYYNGSMECKACIDFMQGCLTCTSSKICTLCDTGFTLSAGKCLCSVSNCQNCTTATICVTCDSGYYVNSAQQCSPCSTINGCLECTSSTFCTLCSGANFFNTTLGRCRPCNQAMPYCQDCDTQSQCLQCTADRYFNGTNCTLCSSAILNCLQCSVSNVCTTCQNITFVNSTFFCQPCSTTIAGCQTCSNSATCTSCDINNILVTASCTLCSVFISQCLNCTTVGPQVQCLLCDQGYFVNPLDFTCVPCNTSVTNCQLCDYQNVCTLCYSPLYYLKSPTQCDVCKTELTYCLQCSSDAKTCSKCLDDRYWLQNSACNICSNWIPHCFRCQDNLSCLQCDSKYHLNPDIVTIDCKLCQLSMQGCSTCDSATFCTSVVNNTYFIYPSNNTVAKCFVQMPHCETCSSESICLSCESGYFLENNLCIKCIQTIDYCLRCSNRYKCEVCASDFMPYDPTGNCTCKVGWYVPSACTSVYGCISAQKFQPSFSTCLMCNSAEHFIYDPINKTCFCDIGYQQKNGICQQFCGNGVHINQECDDGNVLNGDGCNFNCKVEDHFICRGSTYEISNCFIDIQPSITYLYSIRTDGQNKGTHYFLIESSSQFYKIVNFTDLVKINDPRIKILEARYFDGRIQIQFAYNQSCQGEDFVVEWHFNKSFNSSNLNTTFSTKPMRPPLNIIEYEKFFQIVFWFGQILAYLLIALTIFNFFFHKMIAIELVMAFQIIFITGSLSKENISIYRVLTSLRPVLGISKIVPGSTIALIDPQVLRFLSVGRSLIYNLNVSVIIYFAILLTFSILGGLLFKNKINLRRCNEVTAKLQKKLKIKIKFKIQKELSKMEEEKFRLKDAIFHGTKRIQLVYERLLYPISVFFLLPIFVMKTVSLMGSIKGESFLIVQFSSILLEIIFITSLILFSYEVRKIFSGYKDLECKVPFRSLIDCLNKKNYHKYSGVFLIFGVLCVILTITSLQTQRKIALIIIPILTLGFLWFLKSKRSYVQDYHNKVLIFIYSILLFHTILLLIDHYMKIHQIPLLCCLLIIFLCGYVAVLLTLYRIFLQSKEIQKHNLRADLAQPDKRNYKDTLKFNPYVYHEQQSYQFPVPPINQKLTQGFDRILSLANINLIKKDSSTNTSQLDKIKARLRKQIKYLQSSPQETLFVYDR